VNNSGKEPGK